MKRSLTLPLILFVLNISSQNPYWQWEKAIDSLLYEPGTSHRVATDSAGNTYVAGGFLFTPTVGSVKLKNYGAFDVFLLKVDKNGNIAWVTSFGGAQGDVATHISIDPKGYVVVVGSVTDDIIYLNNQAIAQYGTMTDGYVAKFHPNGSLVFFKRMPGNFHESVYSSCTDTKGNILIEGQYFNHLNKFPMGPDTLAATGNYNSKSYLAKLDPSGNILWAKNCFANQVIYQQDFFIATDNNDDIYISTNVWTNKDSIFTFGSAVYSVQGICDAYLGKLNANGNELWSHHFYGQGFQYPKGLAVDKSGGYVHLAVNFNSPVLTTGTQQLFNQGNLDFANFKFDIFGNLASVTSFGSPMSESVNSLVTDKAGNVFCAGSFDGDSLALGSLMAYKYPTSTSTLISNGFIFRTSTNGNILWIKQIKSTSGIRNLTLATDELKQVYVSGVPGSNQNAGNICVFDQNTTYHGSSNNTGLAIWESFFMAQLYDSTIFLNPIGINESRSENVFFGPNPADRKVSVTFQSRDRRHIRVLDELSQTLLEHVTEGRDAVFDLSSLSPGVYMLDIQSSKARITKKLVVSR